MANQLTTLARASSRASSRLGGSVLAGATGLLASCRSAAKPLHPSGEVYAGRLRRYGAAGSAAPLTGVTWLDDRGEDDVEFRLSRAIGLPDGVPDIHGLALRVHAAAGPADLLFATTGTGRLARFVLTPSRHPRSRPMTTLLPYRSPSGPVLLGVEAGPGDTYRLSWARPTGPWHLVATLTATRHLADPPIPFDPVLHLVPGLEQYPAVRRLREPAYRRARRSRDEASGPAPRSD